MKNNFYLVVLVFFVVALLWTNSTDGQKKPNLRCVNRSVQQNFDMKRYMGKWYQLYRYSTLFQRGCECDITNYTMNADGSFVNSVCCLLMNNGFCHDGKASYTKPHQRPLEGKFVTSAPGSPARDTNYIVLETDYDNYTIIYNCIPSSNSQVEDFVWVNSRTPQLNSAISEIVDGLLEKYSFDKSLFIKTNHSSELCGNIEWVHAADLVF